MYDRCSRIEYDKYVAEKKECRLNVRYEDDRKFQLIENERKHED